MSEASEQIEVIRYCDFIGVPVYHIPNEGKRSAALGHQLKRQGLRSGVPDLCIPIARGKYHALYIEMKAPKGRITENQEKWIQTLRKHGNAAFVCFGADNARDLIDRYLKGEM